MEAKYINPFLEAFTKTLEQLGVTNIKRNSLKKKSILFVDQDVSAVIPLKGGIQGHIALSMSQDAAKKLVSAMIGKSISIIDDMSKSVVGELSSMIAGMASTMLIPLGITIQISPPTVILGPSDINSLETLSIDFETAYGKIEFNIGFSI